MPTFALDFGQQTIPESDAIMSIKKLCPEMAQKKGSVNLSRWVKNLCGCKGTVFLRDMQIN